MKEPRVIHLVECPRHGTWLPFRKLEDAQAAYRREHDVKYCDDVRIRPFVETKDA